MTEQTKEPLSVEEPTEKAEEKPTVDVDSLVAELERAGVTNVDDLTGKLEASQQVGRVAQLLGDERKRSETLEARLRELETKPAPHDTDFMDNYTEGRPIDIEAAMERSIDKALNRRDEQQRKIQEANLQKWNFIQSDPDYGLVKEIWEEKLKDPNFVYKVQSGVADPIQQYNETVRSYYKNLLKQSHDTITTMRGGPVPPPHVETGERTSANVVSETPSTTDSEKKIAEMKAKTDKGHIMTPEEELELIDTMFGNSML